MRAGGKTLIACDIAAPIPVSNGTGKGRMRRRARDENINGMVSGWSAKCKGRCWI